VSGMWRSGDLLARLKRLPEPGTRVAPSGPASAEEDMEQVAPRGDHDLNPDLYDPDAQLREAAVLVPIVRRPGDMTVLLTRRAKHLPDHPGQISFPGGSVDPGDADAEAAALREAQEEVGLPPGCVTVVGRLDTYLVRTGFRVVPVVGLLQPPFELQPEEGEVDEIFEVPLAFFLDPANRELHSRMFRGTERFFYAYPFGDYYIWGATAGMLSNLSEVLLQPDLLKS